MEIEQLKAILSRLEELYEKRQLAKTIRNENRRNEALSEVDKDIANYSAFFPYELKEIFNKEVGPNFLNCQHADDISLCIDILKRIIKEKSNV